MRYFTFLLNNMWTSLIQVLCGAKPPLAHPKNTFIDFQQLHYSATSILSFKSDCFTAPELTVSSPFTALCVTATATNDLKNKVADFDHCFFLSLVHFLEMTKQAKHK